MAEAQKQRDMQMLLAAGAHLGTKTVGDRGIDRYLYKRRPDGVHLFHLDRTYEKMKLAARAIVAIENPADIVVSSARPYAQRAVHKFAQYIGCHSGAGRHIPGTFTNQIQKYFSEPRLLIVADPRTDHQPVKETAHVNIPCIALCDTDSPLRYVDIAIPCNTKSKYSLAVMFWILARMVLEMRGTVSAASPWDCPVDMFIYREVDEAVMATEEQDTGVGEGYGKVQTDAVDFGTAFMAPLGKPGAAEEAWGEDAALLAGYGMPGAAEGGFGEGGDFEAAAAPEAGGGEAAFGGGFGPAADAGITSGWGAEPTQQTFGGGGAAGGGW